MQTTAEQTVKPVMSWSGHTWAVAKLGVPLVGGHIAQFAIGLTDTAMLGWYGVDELAAVTLAGSYFFVLFLLGSGFAFALMPIVASATAQDDDRRIRRATRMGLWISLVYGVIVMPFLWFARDVLMFLGQEEVVARHTGDYLRIAGWGIFPALLVMVMKSYLGGLERAQAVLWITVLAAVVNAVANYLLIFGHFGLPELGMAGAAIASLVTQSVSFLVIMGYALLRLPEHDLLRNVHQPDWAMLREIFRHGLPIGLTTLSEASLFTASALMMGWLGTDVLAAHGIAISLGGLTFMLHLGLSNAATIRAGNALGRGDPDHLRRGALVVTAVSFVVACGAAAAFLLIPEPLLALFLAQDDPQRDDIIAAGVVLLALAGLFQLMDAMQVIALGLLRGLLDTAVPMVIAGLSYWAVGIPASYLLGFTFGFGGAGVWVGLVLGLTAAGGLLMVRFWRYALLKVDPVSAGAAKALG